MRRKPSPTEPEAVRDGALEALESLASEHRIRILRRLAEADEPVAFSDLRRRAGIEDTGRFNYHLDQLLGRFVRQTEAGYELGHAGERVVLAATDLDPEAAAMDVDSSDDGRCPVCGERECQKLVHVHLASR